MISWVLGCILRFYPPAFRREFGAEIAAVFWQAASEKRALGRLALLGWLLAELAGSLQAALRLWIHPLNQGGNMATVSVPDQGEKMPRWVIPAILILFLVFALPFRFYALFPGQIGSGLQIALLLLAFVAPLLVGLAARLPRWSLLYTGAVLGGIGFYGTFLLAGAILVVIQMLVNGAVDQPLVSPITPSSFAGRLLYQWMLSGLIWLVIGMLNVVFLGLASVLPGLRAQGKRFWRDFTLLSFSLYGGVLISYMVGFDEWQSEELYVLASMAALAAGAWGYLRAKSAGRRTLALLAGLAVCMAVVAVGKYFLLPLQAWDPWLPGRPPESERWFAVLGTIGAWFWATLFVGLPGLLQALRKSPPVPPILTEA
jgi:hypothetical protein